jgi:hypothetical protein
MSTDFLLLPDFTSWNEYYQVAIGRNYFCLVRTGIDDFRVLTVTYIYCYALKSAQLFNVLFFQAPLF